jgi:hypothetical protein
MAATWYAAFFPGLLPQNTHTRRNRDGAVFLAAGDGITTSSSSIEDRGDGED